MACLWNMSDRERWPVEKEWHSWCPRLQDIISRSLKKALIALVVDTYTDAHFYVTDIKELY